MKLSLVIPCYNEEVNIQPMLDACVAAFEGRLSSYELIFVNDGSRDGTWKTLKELYKQAPCPVKAINFSRNFGKDAAIYAGLQQAAGEYVTVIDGDLQQPPETVLEMVDMLDAQPELDCVAAYQESRNESRFISFCKKRFYRLMDKACAIEFHEGASDFRTFRRGMVEAILSLQEYDRFSKGIFSWVGFNTAYIPYTARPRHAGDTSWSFFKLLRYAIKGIVSFTTFPLKLATIIGAITALLSLFYMVFVVVQKLAFGIAVPGYPTIIVLILLIGGIQMLMLGLLGEYVARVFIQGKHRPLYITKERLSNEDDAAD